MTNIVRKNYDKPNRCPAWSGAGMHTQYPWERNLPHCESGNSGYYLDGIVRGYGRADWAIHRCAECGVHTWPYVLRWLDPLYLLGRLTGWRLS